MNIKQSTAFSKTVNERSEDKEVDRKIPLRCSIGLHKFTISVAPYVMKCENCPKEEYMGP